MTVERAVYSFAGFMVLLSLALTHWVHPGFVWFTVFIGANLFQFGFSGFCPAAMVFKKLGLKTERQCAGQV
ncbi:DUF2892 domain-containing protein [Endozoicomonas sp. SCSIO W0465]|uniref:YgaP family membrane protein n=1 Tax=Endozoicomonas sp. SCSIO W0465 TaxID=2918516 RepID=UPI002074F215|nr:DUF2892 domain-containing protein [Endozoicomonas sp. SCSIO W0465]USE35568.1 DUF2892 domain-containing protein [Endozoicomonas sp. SCSIO W0465]